MSEATAIFTPASPANVATRPPTAKTRRLRIVTCVALAGALLANASPAAAADIRLLSAAAVQSVLGQIAGEFQRTSGHRLVISYATMGAITQRILDGESADLVIGSGQSISRLIRESRIEAVQFVCKTGVGLVVEPGTPKPPMTSVDDFRRALIAAKVIVYANPAGGGAAGIHVAGVIDKLGLTEQLKPKTKFGAGGDVTEVTLAQGQGALGITQISEIVGKSTADYVGPLPGELQNYTDVVAAIPVGAQAPEAVRAFLVFLQSPTAIAAIKARGMEID